MKEFNFNEGDKVSFDDGVVKGNGTIVGCATNGVAILGKTYIVKFNPKESNIEPSTYPFSCFAQFEHFMKKI